MSSEHRKPKKLLTQSRSTICGCGCFAVTPRPRRLLRLVWTGR